MHTIPFQFSDWKMFCGMDEAGRGALAGPLVAASVRLTFPLNHITQKSKIKIRDSKLLSAKQREKIYTTTHKLGAEVVVAIISSLQINNHGIGWANKEIFRVLIRNLDCPYYIIDGNIKIGKIVGKKNRIFSVVDADATIGPVMLAGIVAKVERDRLMKKYHQSYPVYNWRKNKGYGTKEHIEAINTFGSCKFHRTIFVQSALLNQKMNRNSGVIVTKQPG